jgi:choline dehydrogenase
VRSTCCKVHHQLSQMPQARRQRRWIHPWIHLSSIACRTLRSLLMPRVRHSASAAGGSSAINGAQWTRPLAKVPAGWGVAGLDAATAERLYAKAFDTLHVAPPPRRLWQTYLEDRFNALEKLGFTIADGPSGNAVDSAFVNYLYSDKKGRRRDSCTAYLLPLLRGGACRHNLRLVQSATASKIVLKRGRAVAVEYLQSSPESANKPGPDKTTSVARALREVISCAGPYGSPKLLQLSGIGPPEVLREHGVPLVKVLPVGKRTQARPFTYAVQKYGVPLATENNVTRLNDPTEKTSFLAGRKSIYEYSFAADNGVDVKSDAVISATTCPAVPGNPYLLPFCLLNNPARGYVAIASRDPFAPMVVSPNFLGGAGEAARAAACINRQVKAFDYYPKRFKWTPVRT